MISFTLHVDGRFLVNSPKGGWAHTIFSADGVLLYVQYGASDLASSKEAGSRDQDK